MINKVIRLFSVNIVCLTLSETVSAIAESIISGKQIVHNCINANKVVLIQKNELLKRSLDEAEMVSADGQAIVWASKLSGNPLPERVPGIDLMERLIYLANSENHKIFLFGAKEHIVRKVKEIYSEKYSAELVAGYQNGYFSEEEETIIAKDINQSGAQMLFVAIPSPAKEHFIKRQRHNMPNVKLLMGVGGSFDVVSGLVRRAPRWMQDNGLEWLFRLIQEPRKMWRRYLVGNVVFIRLAIKEIFKKSD